LNGHCHLREEYSSPTSTYSPSLIHDIHNNPAAENSNNFLHLMDFADIAHIHVDGNNGTYGSRQEDEEMNSNLAATAFPTTEVNVTIEVSIFIHKDIIYCRHPMPRNKCVMHNMGAEDVHDYVGNPFHDVDIEPHI
jgi:hypothetical protein